jgi:PAS domain S-box-containing protein
MTKGDQMSAQTASFESLLEALPDALVGVDRTGVIQLVNRRTESLFGYERDDLVGQPLEVLVPESRRLAHRVHRGGYGSDPATRAMGVGLKVSGRRRDGTRFPADIALSQLDTGDGTLSLATVRDMTDRKKATEKLDQVNRLAAVVEFSGEAIISCTLDGRITSWNRAAERIFGYSSEEVMGKSLALLSPQDRTGESADALTRVREGQIVEDLEALRIRKDGTPIPVSVTFSPIYDEYGTMIGASAMPRDLTRHRRAFQAARSMIESSLDSLVAISPQGKITDVNEATVAVTGVSREHLIGTDFARYFTDPEKADEIYRLVFTEGMAVDYPLTMRRRDGTLTEVLYNASAYRGPTGKVLGVFAAARDVTRQVKAQKEIAEQQAKERGRLEELERFQRMTIDRALKVIELKKEIEQLGGSRKTKGESDDEW